jgi:Flp pilus assembly protein TadG
VIRHRSRGQALAELAIAAPLVLVLIMGVAQVGVIVYDQVTVDTAAREGARIASEQPNGSQAYSGGAAVAPPYPTCPSSGSTTNPVCNAVWNASGMLNGQSMAVTIQPQSGSSYGDSSCATSGSASGDVEVTVRYNAPIFVPLVGQIFQSSPGVRQVTSSVTTRVEPCSLTQGR